MSNKYESLLSTFSLEDYKNKSKAFAYLSDVEIKIFYLQNNHRENNTGLPEDFDPYVYKRINPDLLHLSNKQLIDHYIVFGKNQNRSYKGEILPEDFDLKTYRYYNPDLESMSDIDLMFHYIKYGKQDLRFYKVEIPEDFDCDGYRYYNPDIAQFSDGWLKSHYYRTGKNENRVYKVNLPEDFNFKTYVFLNDDLNELSEPQLKAHFHVAGKIEHRRHKDDFFDEEFFIKHNNITNYTGYDQYQNDIRQVKSQKVLDIISALPERDDEPILLISHDSSLYGATNYLYILYNLLKNKYNKKVVIVDIHKNPILIEKFNVIENDLYSYANDSTILYHLIKKIKPSLLYFNCMNSEMQSVSQFFPREKCLFHSHEVKMHYHYFSKKIIPDFTVSQKISKTYEPVGLPNVQWPIINQEFVDNIINSKPTDNLISNAHGLIDKEKVTIGMCGSATDRKNFKLFKELAKAFAKYNFLWIGGDRDISDPEIKNFYHVQNVQHPFGYFHHIDYFLLTCLIETCGYVLLENMLLGNKTITFSENIHTDHKRDYLKDLYFEYDGEVNLQTASEAILKWVGGKYEKNNELGLKYVTENFMHFSEEFKNKLNI
jgi:hypothetical protein